MSKRKYLRFKECVVCKQIKTLRHFKRIDRRRRLSDWHDMCKTCEQSILLTNQEHNHD